MEGLKPAPAARELRLYQAEHLLRQYGFRYDELVFGGDGNLPLDRDPKTEWALRQTDVFPLEIAAAPYELLLRVPGLGPTAARILVSERRRAVIRSGADLRRLGIDASRAAYFLAWRGRRLAVRPEAQQLRLFPHGEHLTLAPFRTAVPPCAYR
jgi:predicted DNA-binding helix-hairpin-helix protein